jgi:hypothetical protein
MNENEAVPNLFLETLKRESFSEIIAFIDAQSDALSLLILAAGLSDEEIVLLDEFCIGQKKRVWGAIFPKIILNGESISHGIGLFPLPYTTKTRYLDVNEHHFSDRLHETFSENEETDGTLFIFFDAACQNDDEWFETIYNHYGVECHYLGGGTGASVKPSLITSSGIKKGGLLLTMLTTQGIIGKRHGWESFSGPYQVTKMQQNELMELDWRPVSEALKEQSPGIDSPPDGDIIDSKIEKMERYLFGISKIGGEKLLRTGYYDAKKGKVILHYPLPAGNFVYLMQENQHTMELAAPLTLLKAEDEFKLQKARFMIFFDCELRRQQIPDDNLKNSPLGKQAIGIVSDGQIACSGSDYPELLESTFCLGLLP